MDQETHWLTRYNEVKTFIEENHRNPSKHYPEEKLMHNWAHQNRKLMNQGKLKKDRAERFNKLLEIGERYKRVNQYQ